MQDLDRVMTGLLQQSRFQGRRDEELLADFALRKDEAAFAELVRRYTYLVSGTCRAVLRDAHAAEDAYQATFLILARRAPALTGRPLALGSYLYRVARRLALRARVQSNREKVIAEQAELAARLEGGDPGSEVTWREVQRALHEELERLSEKFRLPFLLCFVEGLTQEEAARRLGMPRGTLRLRLDRARALLQRRLTRRGITLAALTTLALRLPQASAATVAATARAALAFAADRTSPDLVRQGALLLAGWLLRPSLAPALVAAAVAFLAVAGGTAAYLARPVVAPPAAPLVAHSAPGPVANGPPADVPPPAVIPLPGRVTDPEGRPAVGVEVVVVAERMYHRGRLAAHDQVLARGITGAGGEFRLDVPSDFPTWSPDVRMVKLLARAPGTSLTVHRVFDLWGGLPAQEVRLPRPSEIRGRVVTADGKPVVGAAVRTVLIFGVMRDEPAAVGDELPCWPAAVRSDASGEFVIPGLHAAAQVGVVVTAPGYCLAFGSAPPAGQTWAVRLQPVRPLRGTVVAEDTGLPLAGCVVSISSRSLSGPFPITHTDAAGRFEVPAGDDRRFVYAVYPPDGQPYPALGGVTTQSEGEGEITVRVPRGTLVAGAVRDADTGRPIPGARILLSAAKEKRSAGPVPVQGGQSMVVSGPDGRFRLAVPNAPCALVVHGPTNEFVSETFKWRDLGGRNVYAHGVLTLDLPAEAGEREVEVRLRRGVRVRCEVVDADGRPDSGAVVVCRSMTSLLLPVREGGFSVPGRRPGWVTRVAVLNVAAGTGGVAEVGPDAGETPVIRLQAFSSARVRFVDGEGRPLVGHVPTLALLLQRDGPAGDPPPEQPAGDGLPLSVIDPRNYAGVRRTDVNGWVEFPALIPGAKYELSHQTPPGVVSDARFTAGSGQKLTIPDVTLRQP